MDTWKKMDCLKRHISVAFAIRLALIAYGEFQDQFLVVPYTDIDYRVFTDAARHTWEGSSPYARYTYRYTPLIAWLLIPNLWIAAWGKILFSVLDLVVGWLIYKVVVCQGSPEPTAIRCSLAWLYNPLSIVISTRGNSDTLSALLVLGSLFFIIQTCAKAVLAGILLGLAIHIRLYPIVFSLPMYLCLTSGVDNKQGLKERFLAAVWPNRERLQLTLSCCITLALCTGIGWRLYGWPFLEESIFYHFYRRDIRHNFSIYFYLMYLYSGQPFPTWLRFIITLPQVVLLLAIAVTFGMQRRNLPFCMFIQAVVMVAYNSVVTAQYFVWFMSLLPIIFPFLMINFVGMTQCGVVWIGAQCAWLIPAYILEFQGENVFQFVWLHSLLFFGTTLFTLSRLIKTYGSPKNHLSKAK